jgi:hypothetical protein
MLQLARPCEFWCEILDFSMVGVKMSAYVCGWLFTSMLNS